MPPRSGSPALDEWSARLLAAAYGEPSSAATSMPTCFSRSRTRFATCRLPVPLLQDLLSAFRQDVTVTRYETWADVLDYCRRSANPVGRLVLRIAGYDDPALDAQSDAVCTALQLTNFWQDSQIDWRRGRLYVPRESGSPRVRRETDLDAAQLTPEWRPRFARSARRTRALFDAGRRVCDGVDGRLRLGAARDLARRHADPGQARSVRSSTSSLIVRRSAATDAAAIAWRVIRWS